MSYGLANCQMVFLSDKLSQAKLLGFTTVIQNPARRCICHKKTTTTQILIYLLSSGNAFPLPSGDMLCYLYCLNHYS